jgi:hypothetical protein
MSGSGVRWQGTPAIVAPSDHATDISFGEIIALEEEGSPDERASA